MQPTFVKLDLPLYDNNGNILRESVVTNLEVESCTSEHFGGHFSTHGYCLGVDQEVTIGVISQEIILVNFRKCNNATSPIPCAD